MSLYDAYIAEVEKRKTEGLSAKPIDDAALLSEVIAQIRDEGKSTSCRFTSLFHL